MPQDTGDGGPAHGGVTMVTVIGDLGAKLIVIACSAAVHDVTGVKTRLSRFLCWEWERFAC